MDILHFVYQSIDGYLGSFHVLAVMNNDVASIHGQVSGSLAVSYQL